MKKTILNIIFIFLIILPFCKAIAESGIVLAGKFSPYSARVLACFNKKMKEPAVNSESIQVTALYTENDHLYIGFEQSFVINASMDRVSAVIEDFKSYPSMFNDIVKAEIIKRDDDSRFILRQEQKIPVFFIPNLVYDMSYNTVRSSDKAKFYIYRLCGGKGMKYNDGIIMLKKISKDKTALYELDFVLADWSALGSISKNLIWKSVIEGGLQANIVIKLRSENPGLEISRCKEAAKKICSGINFKEIVNKKIAAGKIL